jgi:hypothetical protein
VQRQISRTHRDVALGQSTAFRGQGFIHMRNLRRGRGSSNGHVQAIGL